jgi:hypothetical protein
MKRARALFLFCCLEEAGLTFFWVGFVFWGWVWQLLVFGSMKVWWWVFVGGLVGWCLFLRCFFAGVGFELAWCGWVVVA